MQAANNADDAGLVSAQVGEGGALVNGCCRRPFRAERGQKIILQRARNDQGMEACLIFMGWFRHSGLQQAKFAQAAQCSSKSPFIQCNHAAFVGPQAEFGQIEFTLAVHSGGKDDFPGPSQRRAEELLAG